jgi:hypothetical protein
MQPQPKLLKADIAERINKLLEPDYQNDLMLHSVKKDIEKLMRIDAIEAHRLSAAVCCVEKDKAGLNQHYKIVLEGCPDDYSYNKEFAGLLSNSGLVFDALNYARRAHSLQKTPEILKLLIEITTSTARFQESLGYLAELKKMKIDASKENALFDSGVIDFLNRSQLSDDDVSFVVEKADFMAHENNFEVEQIKAAVYHDGVEEWLSIDLFIKATPKQAVKLEVDFVDDLVISMPENFPISKISCGFATV